MKPENIKKVKLKPKERNTILIKNIYEKSIHILY